MYENFPSHMAIPEIFQYRKEIAPDAIKQIPKLSLPDVGPEVSLLCQTGL